MSDLSISDKQLIPVIDVDFVISDAKSLYDRRGPLLYMTNPWWANTNRHLLVTHLCRLYQFCLKHKLPYKDAVRFMNRTVYHYYPTARAVVRETSQSIGSTTLRAHFRDLSGQFGIPSWSELFEIEERFWSVQKSLRAIDSYGAITKLGSKRVYILWEAIYNTIEIAKGRGLAPVDFLDFAMHHTKPLSPGKYGASVGLTAAKSNEEIGSLLPSIRARSAFALEVKKEEVGRTVWYHKIGLKNAKFVSGSIPLGFYIAYEHAGMGGSMEDVVEVTPSGQYLTRDGTVFHGDYWFKKIGNPWLVVQVNDKNASRVNLDLWYNPSRYDDVPTLGELSTIEPDGVWTKVWNKVTGGPISAQAGGLKLKRG